MPSQHTVRFGDAITDIIPDEDGNTGIIADSDGQNATESHERGAAVPSSNSGSKNKAAASFRQIRTQSLTADQKAIRRSNIQRILRSILSVDAVDKASSVMDFTVNALFVIGFAVTGFYTVWYIAKANPVMSICCAGVLWVMIKASGSIGKQSE